jgi:hypothetical protein
VSQFVKDRLEVWQGGGLGFLFLEKRGLQLLQSLRASVCVPHQRGGRRSPEEEAPLPPKPYS